MIGPKYVVLTKVLAKNRVNINVCASSSGTNKNTVYCVIPKIALIKAQANQGLTVSGIFRRHFFPNPTINTVLQ